MKQGSFFLISLLAALSCTLVACNSDAADEEARRSLIIEDYIHGQEVNYGWPEGSTTVSDEGSFLFVKQVCAAETSYIFCDNASYVDPSSTLYAPSGQVEADLLKHSLESNVLIAVYSSDGYLLFINYGQYSDASEEECNQAEERIGEIASAAKNFASENKEAWLEGFCSSVLPDQADSYLDVTYETTASETVITMAMVPGAYVLFDDEARQQEFDGYWQRYAEHATLFTGTDVRIDFLSADTGEVERSFASAVKDPLYVPDV